MSHHFQHFNEPFSSILDFGERVTRTSAAIARIQDADVAVGVTPKTQTFSTDKVTLHHYQPMTDSPATDPVLIVYGLVGRYTMIDLQEDRSLVRNLLSRGVDLYVIDWGYPGRADRLLGFDDYVGDYLDACVNHICQQHGIERVNLLGICEGGVFATLYAARRPEKIRNLMVSITPIDFDADVEDQDPGHGFLNLWIRNLEDRDIEKLVDSFGNLPGELMGAVFQAMTPIRSITKYNLDLIHAAGDEQKLLNFLRMEKWLADRPHHPGKAAKQWLIDLYKHNRLVKGTFELEGEAVDLGDVTAPVLNIYAERDHIIPPPCSSALGRHVGSQDYTELALPGGHVGIYVSSRLQGLVGKSIVDWLGSRQ